MKDLIWQSDEREIPGVGVVTKGRKFSAPDHVARSLVYQGLANYKPNKEEKKK